MTQVERGGGKDRRDHRCLNLLQLDFYCFSRENQFKIQGKGREGEGNYTYSVRTAYFLN